MLGQCQQAHASQGARAMVDAGPADGPPLLHDFLGGDVLASVMASVSFDLPLEALRVSGFRGHVRPVSCSTMLMTLLSCTEPRMTQLAVLQMFLNGGNTMLLCGTGVPFQQTFQQFRSTFRWTMVSLR